MPSTIRVYFTATKTIKSLDFYTYLKGVLPAEWGPSWKAESLRAGAMACKMFAWYRVQVKPRSTTFDIYDDTSDQVYNPAKVYSTTTQAINDVGGVGLINSSGNLFLAQYNEV